jgi:membrane protein implicated in regulation of membrane protease activity
MRGTSRQKIIAIGGAVVVCALTATGIGALTTGRLGWSNYWGGFVFAPFALIIAGLLAVKVIRGRATPTKRRRRR